MTFFQPQPVLRNLLGRQKTKLNGVPAKQPIPSSVISRVLQLYEEILSFSDLSPSPLVNKALSDLVSLCLQYQDLPISLVLSCLQRAYGPRHFSVSKLQSACMQAECAMESLWASRIALTGLSITEFWYLDNYRRTVEHELESLRASTSTSLLMDHRKRMKAAFIGSGPLPLTAWILAETCPALGIILVDRDESCHDAARAWLDRSGGSGRFKFVVDEVGSASGNQCKKNYLSDVDVVWVGACVGSSPRQKTGILSALRPKMKPGSLVIVRSVSGMGALLYPQLEDDALEVSGFVRKGCTGVIKSRDVVNHVVIGEVVE